VKKLTEGRGADAVLEAVGSPAATRLAVDLVRPGGVIASVGVHTEEHLAFSPVEAYDKNLTYRSGRCPARHYMDRLLPLVADGVFPVDAVVSHRLPLEEGPRAYAIFDAKQDGCTKVVLET
jgi:threonine dehydrogenase-like Zn-dependent dehydrogenase